MNIYELIDRWGKRRHERMMAKPRRPMDVKSFIGLLFLLGYYAMVWQFSKRALPTENLDLIRDAMLTLGPPVGAIVNSLFRSDIRDEIQAGNTREGFRAMGKQADATKAAAEGTPPLGGGEEGSLKSGDEVELTKKE